MSGSFPVDAMTLPEAFARYHEHYWHRSLSDRSRGWQRRECVALRRFGREFFEGNLFAEIHPKGEVRRKLTKGGWKPSGFGIALFAGGVIDEVSEWEQWAGETPFVDTAKFEVWLAGERLSPSAPATKPPTPTATILAPSAPAQLVRLPSQTALKGCVSKARARLRELGLSDLTRTEVDDLLKASFPSSTRSQRRTAAEVVPEASKRRTSAVLSNRSNQLSDLRQFLSATE